MRAHLCCTYKMSSSHSSLSSASDVPRSRYEPVDGCRSCSTSLKPARRPRKGEACFASGGRGGEARGRQNLQEYGLNRGCFACFVIGTGTASEGSTVSYSHWQSPHTCNSRLKPCMTISTNASVGGHPRVSRNKPSLCGSANRQSKVKATRPSAGSRKVARFMFKSRRRGGTQQEHPEKICHAPLRPKGVVPALSTQIYTTTATGATERNPPPPPKTTLKVRSKAPFHAHVSDSHGGSCHAHIQ